ncbi:PREDICTED: (-)-isopiperitenol/(-)-carveol dehydrogenase, mitochondrial-like [Ipomoea nil]|uniref:(-)-isopiperitenol/(-)-carveol dehydrogenase, mitochondrial-like n=1 Tax=Ipomoea nil TaxID=35883 RepID=UPI00090199CD|nr:PREDICTED: (-)-isopiperitenol/(-)-carveol dehydrogenase, mitochondrial-like [Ipomoea nil]XP_019182020.1 PREDICTED: (-)-isopiperitenol/(-)-carveol dehydrogenase, mitochondrial-like [Ipomoea nil]
MEDGHESKVNETMGTSNSCMKKLQGKVVIVTGGASGIGEATARLFADHGTRAVVIADIQDEKGVAVAEAIGLEKCSFVKCDVSDEEQVKAMVDWTVQKYGRLDVMFSNAGTASPSDQKVLDLDFSHFDRVFRVNARGTAVCVKHAARAMVEGRVRGSIICTASMAATRGGVRRTDYIMSKHAVLGLVRSASQQLGAHGIRVNCVSPSATPTPMILANPEKASSYVEKIYGPLTSLKGITSDVKHVANAVLFLASDDSAFITGHDLVVDGGLICLAVPGPGSS